MPAKKKKKIAIGDIVNVQLGRTAWKARIVEDRGHFRIAGGRIYRVALLDDNLDEPMFTEVVESEITSPAR
ncbi:MAG TPA: hypothetical protein VH253_13955 [Phycisphaerae bacterium]|nr:hypothetical protein [Phycisphaerae bacterium]